MRRRVDLAGMGSRQVRGHHEVALGLCAWSKAYMPPRSMLSIFLKMRYAKASLFPAKFIVPPANGILPPTVAPPRQHPFGRGWTASFASLSQHRDGWVRYIAPRSFAVRRRFAERSLGRSSLHLIMKSSAFWVVQAIAETRVKAAAKNLKGAAPTFLRNSFIRGNGVPSLRA